MISKKKTLIISLVIFIICVGVIYFLPVPPLNSEGTYKLSHIVIAFLVLAYPFVDRLHTGWMIRKYKLELYKRRFSGFFLFINPALYLLALSFLIIYIPFKSTFLNAEVAFIVKFIVLIPCTAFFSLYVKKGYLRGELVRRQIIKEIIFHGAVILVFLLLIFVSLAMLSTICCFGCNETF